MSWSKNLLKVLLSKSALQNENFLRLFRRNSETCCYFVIIICKQRCSVQNWWNPFCHKVTVRPSDTKLHDLPMPAEDNRLSFSTAWLLNHYPPSPLDCLIQVGAKSLSLTINKKCHAGNERYSSNRIPRILGKLIKRLLYQQDNA